MRFPWISLFFTIFYISFPLFLESPIASDVYSTTTTTKNASSKLKLKTTREDIKPILILLPEFGFDPVEASVPFSIWKTQGYTIKFATRSGLPSRGGDPKMILGVSLLFNTLEMKTPEHIIQNEYSSMLNSTEYNNPLSFKQAGETIKDFSCLFFPGGHHPDLSRFFNDQLLHQVIIPRAVENKLVFASVCHGILPLYRSGMLSDTKLNFTALPAWLEYQAVALTYLAMGHENGVKNYQMATTYPNSVQSEVGVLPGYSLGHVDLLAGLLGLKRRGWAMHDSKNGITLVSARFWGDAKALADRVDFVLRQ